MARGIFRATVPCAPARSARGVCSLPRRFLPWFPCFPTAWNQETCRGSRDRFDDLGETRRPAPGAWSGPGSTRTSL